MPFLISEEFKSELIALLPKLRVQALSLTRNPSDADDLVQAAVCNAIAAHHTFIPGTNFPAWMHRIVRNRFISNLRQCRDTVKLDDVPAAALTTLAPHEDRLILGELEKALARLPPDQLEALLMVVIQGMSYQKLAELSGCAIGTAKSRVFRARRNLQIWLLGENPDMSDDATTGRIRRISRRKHVDQAHLDCCAREQPSASYL